MTVIHIQIKRPILRLASKNNGRDPSIPKNQDWNKPKVTNEKKRVAIQQTQQRLNKLKTTF